MKKICIPSLMLMLLSVAANAQFTFTGTGSCPTQGATLTTQPDHLTISEVTRTGLTCSSTADWFNSTAWNTGATIDEAEYIEVSLTAATGYIISATSISFNAYRSSTGPANSRIAHDGGTGAFTVYSDFSTGTSSAPVNWNFTDFSTTAAATIKFRIYGWNATSSAGSMRIDDLNINVAVTPVGSSGATTPFTFDSTNTLAGLGKTPTQKLDVEGNIRTSKLFIGAVDDARITDLVSDTPNNYLLVVNGTALFTKAKVKAIGNWPDYVFEDKYHLLPLNKLEQFVRTNKHLPDIPTAFQMGKDGIDIGSIQTTLVQKIEELTLYAIEQNKKTELLQKQNEQLLLRIEKLEKLITEKSK